MKSNFLIHPYELNRKWVDRAIHQKVDILGLHPEGGKLSTEKIKLLLEQLREPTFRALLDEAADHGVELEYEFHAGSFLLPRELFAEHPEYFLMNEAGERTPSHNFCFSNEEAMSIVAENAVKLAKSLYRSRPYFYFWLDDQRNSPCHCEKCRALSPSDQYLLFVNRIAKALGEAIPGAKVCYLAYYDLLYLPTTIKPEPNVFLEFAPIDKYIGKEYKEVEQRMMQPLLDFFGREDAKVLEYWLDNSLFSHWKRPPQPFSADPAVVKADVEFYRDAGFDMIGTFACYLGEDYEELHGEPDITPFTKAFQ